MRKSVFGALSCLLFSLNLYGADVVCSCPDNQCSDVIVNFVPSNPGVYMTVEYAYGERNMEGFAQVTRDRDGQRTVFTLGNFVLVEKENKYSLPGREVDCQ